MKTNWFGEFCLRHIRSPMTTLWIAITVTISGAAFMGSLKLIPLICFIFITKWWLFFILYAQFYAEKKLRHDPFSTRKI